MRYSQKDLHILSTLEMQAAASFAVVGRACRCKDATVRYALSRFIDDGVIVTRRVYVNSDLLGFTNYAFYLTLALGQERSEIEKFRNWLAKQPRVNWLADIGGDYQCGFRIAVQNIAEMLAFWERLSRAFGQVIVRKETSIRALSSTFARTFNTGLSRSKIELKQGGEACYELTEIDRKVLLALSERGFDSFRRLSERFDIPSSTFDRRLKALEKIGVIQGYSYILNVERLGLQEYRLLVHTRNHQAGLSNRLLQFAREHLQIRKFLQCIGSWDFEFEVTVANGYEVSTIAASIQQKFRDEVEYIRTVPLFGEVSCPPYTELQIAN